jgi:thioredoxin
VAFPVTITDATFKAEVFESERPVLVDFWAQWCEPCKALVPVLDEVAATLAGQIKVARVDVDSNPTSAASFGVQNLPTLILFKNGKPAERFIGAMPKGQLMDRLAPHLI